MFPLWLKAYFPRDEHTTHTEAYISWPKNVITRSPIDLRKLRQGHTGSKTLRVVCRPCNNGWLSSLEDWANRALPPLIVGGRRCSLLPEGQKKLASWAAKTTMVASRSRPRPNEITQEERTFLMENGKPPDNWFVWIGTYQGVEWRDLVIFQSRSALSPTPFCDPDFAPYYVQATTFGIGHILFCVVSSSFPGINEHFLGKETAGFVQIWPPQPRSVLWPTARILHDPQAYGTANILQRSKAFDHTFDPGAHWTCTLD